MRYGLELKIPRLSNKVMEMKNEANNLEAASIDASTNAVQRRCAEVRAGRPNARERRPTHGRLEWKPDGRLFGGRKRLEAPSRRRSLQTCLWIFFPLLVCDPVQQPNGGQYVLDTAKMAGSRKTASTNKY